MWLKCLCTLSYLVGHVYVVIAPNYNNEQTEYWLARCVEPKKKLTCHQVDDDGFEYLIGSIVVVCTSYIDTQQEEMVYQHLKTTNLKRIFYTILIRLWQWISN